MMPTPLLTLSVLITRNTEPDTKEGLAPYWNQRIMVQAVFQRFGYTEHARRVAVLQQVTYDGQLVASHVWIPAGSRFKALHLKRGNLIQFEARVMRYVKNDPAVFHYGLDDIAEPCVLRRKPIL